MFGNFFDPFMFGQPYQAPQRRQYRNPYGIPSPYRAFSDDRGSSSESSDDEYISPQRIVGGPAPDELRRQELLREQRRQEEEGRKAREMEARKAYATRQREAQFERARQQERLRKKQKEAILKEMHVDDNAVKVPVQLGVQEKQFPQYTLLEKKDGYIAAANVPGYPADAIQISASEHKLKVYLNEVKLNLDGTKAVPGYQPLDKVFEPICESSFEISLPNPIDVSSASASLSGGRLLTYLPFKREESIESPKSSRQSASAPKKESDGEDVEDWTSILKGIGSVADKTTATPISLVPITLY